MADNQANVVVNRRVMLNTISNYFGKVVNLVAWFFLTPFILTHLGETIYGLWVLVGSVVAYGSLLDFGINGAVTKYVAEYRAKGDKEQAHSLVSTALVLHTIIGFIIIVISGAIALVFPDLFSISPDQHATATWLMFFSGVNVGLSIPSANASAVLRGLQRFDLINLTGIIGTILSTTATIVVLVSDGGAIGIVLVSIASNLIMLVPKIWIIYRIAPELRFGFRGANRKFVRLVGSFSSALFMIHLGGQFETRSDEIVIGASLPVSAITPYNIARKLSTLPQTLTEQFLSLILPLASGLHAENNKVHLRSLYITSTRLTLAIFLPIAASLVILAKPILSLWVGDAYTGYAYLIVILTFASLIDTSQWPAGFVLQGMARHKFPAILALCSGIMNLGLSIVFVRFLGITGVALGSLIPTTIISLGFVLPYAMRLIGVSHQDALKEMFFPALIPAIPMILVIFILHKTFVQPSLITIGFTAGIGFLVYIIAYLSQDSNTTERGVFRKVILSTIRFAKVYIKSS